jgi:hypothetical protein
VLSIWGFWCYENQEQNSSENEWTMNAFESHGCNMEPKEQVAKDAVAIDTDIKRAEQHYILFRDAFPQSESLKEHTGLISS